MNDYNIETPRQTSEIPTSTIFDKFELSTPQAAKKTSKTFKNTFVALLCLIMIIL